MDRRERKTKQNLYNAFLELRSRKSLERISIKELAEKADISKATFYLHYRDIYDLSEQLEQEIIDDILAQIENPEEIFTDASSFTRKFMEAFLAHKNLTDILFSGSRAHVLPDQIDRSIRAYIYRQRPELKSDAGFNITLSYRIKGSYYAFLDNTAQADQEQLIKEICRIAGLF